MLPIFNPYRALTDTALLLRMVLAFLCGGIIGMEREYKRRPAGFRTHILICMGAAMTTLTSQHLALHTGFSLDIARLGAQVIAGIGFIGAGTIIVTKRQRVKGLTTAAGLWVSAIIGLALGLGFYEAGIIVTVLVLLAEVPFSLLEYRIASGAPELNLYIGCTGTDALHRVETYLQENGVRIMNTEIFRTAEDAEHAVAAILLLRFKKKAPREELIHTLLRSEGVTEVYEL